VQSVDYVRRPENRFLLQRKAVTGFGQLTWPEECGSYTAVISPLLPTPTDKFTGWCVGSQSDR
jgi:hypothetical protein